MHSVYILQSNSSGRYYTGETSSIDRRLSEHKKKKSSFGKRNRDLVLVYSREFHNRIEARKFENFLKRQKSRTFIERLVSNKISAPL